MKQDEITNPNVWKYITGNVSTPEEKQQIMEWARANEGHMEELAALRRLYDVLLWRGEGRKKPECTANGKERLFISIVAAAVVACLLIGGSLYVSHVRQQILQTVMQTIHIPAGQRAELILADGTNVWLNASSTLIFPNIFPPDKRIVALDGEAYFVVTENSEKPFIVETPFYDITVLGTEFNVLSYSDSPLFEVSLLRGSVEVCSENKSQAVRIEPQTRVYRKDNRLITETINNYNYLLWKDGLICFDDESIDHMITKLELYYGVRIVVRNESFKKQKYTGKFQTKDGIEHILKVFQLKEKFTYEKDDEKNMIIID